MACNSSTIYGTIWFTKNRRKKHDMARRNAERNTIIMLHEWMQKSAGFGARRNAGKKPLCVTRRQTKKSTIWPRRNKETMRCVLRKCKKKHLFLAQKNVLYMIYCKRYSWAALKCFFPERVARVPVSLWGFGVEGVFAQHAFIFATVRDRPQPFATIPNRSQPFATVRVRAVWPCLW